MNKLDLAKWLARKSHRSHAQAADDVDKLMYRIVKEWKQSGKAPGSRLEKEPSKWLATSPKGKQ